MSDEIAGGRLRRLFRLGWLSRRAIPIAWKRVREVGSGSAAHAALAEELLAKHAGIAEEAFATLGELKGLAVKIGQMVAYLDGALPAAYRPIYQKVMARLLHDVPALPWSTIEPLLARELGAPVAARFRDFEPAPFAAASIGQVHRAHLPDGTPVAVKIQYPGVERALTADLDNATLMRRLFVPLLGLAGGASLSRNLAGVMAEVRARMMEELDYVHEAAMQERFRARFAGDPDVLVPHVYRELSSRRVLVSELVVGRTLAEVAQDPQAARNRYGAILTRWYLRGIYDFRLFNADPHPGNYLFPSDGRIAFLDYGCIKEIDDGMHAAITGYFRAALRAERTGTAADQAAFDAAICAAFKLDLGDPLYPLYREFILYCLAPYLCDADFTFSPEYAGASIDLALKGMKHAAFGQGKLPRIPKLPPMPPGYTFLSRLQWGFYSVMATLGARGNWHGMLPASLLD